MRKERMANEKRAPPIFLLKMMHIFLFALGCSEEMMQGCEVNGDFSKNFCSFLREEEDF